MEDRIAALRARVAALPPAQVAAFRAKVEAAGIDWADVMPDAPAARPSRLPLSPGQMHFWLLQQLDPDSAAFNIVFTWDVDGPLDPVAMEQALAFLVARHEPLRTGFPEEDGAPWQSIETPQFALESTEAEDDAEAARIERAFADRPFDLARPPLFRASLVRRGEGRATVLFAFHHIIADGWSRGVFLRELAACYQSFAEGQTPSLPPLEHQFADLMARRNDWLGSPAAKAQEAFWRDRLSGLQPQELPVIAHSDDRRAETHLFHLEPKLSARIGPAAAALGVTPFVLLLAVFQLLLHREGGAPDIAVGTPVAGRDGAAETGLIGLFVNTLVLRGQPRGDLPFSDWMATTREGFAEAFDHQDLPFARVVEVSGAPRQPGRVPLFQTLFQVQTGYGDQNADRLTIGSSLQVTQRVIPLRDAKFDLSWHMLEREGQYSAIVEFRPAIFGATWAKEFCERFQCLLQSALDNPDAPLATLCFVPEGAAVMVEGPQEKVPDLSDLLSRYSTRDNLAVIETGGGATTRFADLHAQAQKLAHVLCAHPDLAAGGRVAICLPRGTDMVVALLACLMAGVPYVPLDPAHPKARRETIVRDAGVSLILGWEWADAPCPVMDPAALPADVPEADLPAVAPESLAYVIFTSGSTGAPKGVPVTRAALANLLNSVAARPGIAKGDRLLAVTTPAFDIAALEILLPLVAGATLVMAASELARQPDALCAALKTHDITHMQATPALWRAMVDHGWKGHSGLTALCGGEAMPGDLARALLDRTGTLWNMYGPTETTIWSATLPVTPALANRPEVPIGGPLANTGLCVLDRYDTALPAGVPGELAISGAGLSPGYWQRDDLSAESFVAKGSARLYRTGDLARLEPDGTFTFLGRRDHQIKLNGYRIEPAEIEAALLDHPQVTQALVIADGQRLVGYVRAASDVPSSRDMKAHLGQTLPGYMIPHSFVVVDSFALNANGKIDRSQLPTPDAAGAAQKRSPETETERQLHRIWMDVLGRDEIGIDDNFFGLGGASVSAMQIASRARDVGIVLTPAQMFECQTIAEQARATIAGATHLPMSPWQKALHAGGAKPLHSTLKVDLSACVVSFPEAVRLVTRAQPALRFALSDKGWMPETGGPLNTPLPETALWQARQVEDCLHVTASPCLLDQPSLDCLAHLISEAMHGRAVPDGGTGFADWLNRAAPASMPIDPLPAKPVPAGSADPVSAQIATLPTAENCADALLRVLSDWQGGAAVSLALIDRANVAALGQMTRLRAFRHTGRNGSANPEVAEAAPADVPEGSVVLNWNTAPANLIARPALSIEARTRAKALSLVWRFDPSVVSHAIVSRLAARHAAALAPKPTAKGSHKLDQLRARLTQGVR